ncbi:uncharacterized protein ColSpa_02909 [Colletotrichum spaethianum]|uniref:Uncharacterized protein n=1 Tax=Colletotrichum spaethianum TaxID=700344 RepID=A0AA37NZW7_9PEZI|nr:uncharacterized protein ColSpa_02909 [Colletotrichum spaethianum]GKT42728.1 hypothetical protein ColSpa_02909 [Colletotrichum spaethianum]
MSTENEPASSNAAPYSFTLKDLTASTWVDHSLGRTAYGMKNSGFHRWGFVIYRTTYNDDTACERYLEALKLTVRCILADEGGDVLLEQYMDWLVISDQAMLDGASKADVRKHFRSWCAARSKERDGPGATRSKTKRLPRFRHCVYVDQKCLDTLAALPANQDDDLGELSNVVAVVIDGAFDKRTPGDDEGSYPDIEGCTERYVGWRYEGIDMLVHTYEESHNYPLSHIDYKRPPLISPNGLSSMPA